MNDIDKIIIDDLVSNIELAKNYLTKMQICLNNEKGLCTENIKSVMDYRTNALKLIKLSTINIFINSGEELKK